MVSFDGFLPWVVSGLGLSFWGEQFWSGLN